ncbi:hypothetical protein [Parahaliea mediterranea]|uniref:Tetratricopeptide repeat protein n=1 Tax=Parahaliea mediterranea TaxID=651086 RepID=A0A939DCH3_9GAMM|nr:hypothetical protein [Parahaliea mediterranea]MBN7795621.1 hypothetical protein [Parahaliea mediterranea]
MSRENDHLTPTPFEPAQAQQARPAPTTGGGERPSWVLPALLGLLLLAAAVLFLLPQPDPDPTAPPIAQDATGPDAPTGRPREGPAGPDATPWADAQQAQLRKEAQDVLGELLELQRQLQERGVEQWAPQDFANATAAATAGDELYKQRDYVPARERYQAGLAQLRAIEDSVPERLAARLERVREAIEAADPELANTNLNVAALLAPDSPEVAALRERLDKLPAVMNAMKTAAAAEAGGDLAAAVAALEQATGLAPQHQGAAAELARVGALHTEERFNRAMSEGYAALDEARFNDARRAFQQARELRPGAGEADSALRELQATETAHRLATLKRRGAALEAEEDWQAAAARYESALEIDASVVFAQEGLARARPRAKLQEQLEAVIDKPERLADPTVASATGKLLAQAREASPAGPVLREQIERIDRLLTQANKPITVTLRSDQQTSVTVYKVARLGQFAERELDLRPGTYTAVGTRNGYRDVRRSFTVSPEQTPEPVVIACTEPI